MRPLFLTMIFLTILSLSGPKQFHSIVTALKSGNPTGVASFFDSTVEISVFRKSNILSKQKAEIVLADFFNSNKINGFEVVHKSQKKGSGYCIGNLSTDNGLYRTTIFMKQVGDKLLVQELRFEK